MKAGIHPDYKDLNVTCSCGKTFQPPTTMLRYQTVQCPKCGKEARFDWNV